MSWRSVGTADDLGPGRTWLPVRVDGRRFALARVDGTWFGVEDRCTHAGCPFSEEASLEGGTIVCNCHGSEFELASGEVLRGPAEYPVATVPVRERDGVLEVDA